MEPDLFSLLQEARNWLASRSEPEILSPEWQTGNHLRLFIDLLEKDSSLPTLEIAIQNLRRHLISKTEWSADYTRTVSRFCSQADQIRRRMKNAGANSETVG